MAEGLTTIRRIITVMAFVGPALAFATWSTNRVLGKSEVEQESTVPITLPLQYRDWRLISVAHEAGKLNDLRAVLGNDSAIEAYRANTLPFPDGTIIARLAWVYTASEENNKAFGQQQSFVAGSPTNIQLMVKDSKRYASTGGWGFAQFNDGKLANAEATKGCFACHAPVKSRDYVFTRYAH